jgi:succinoglycan biosynthesis protein ExoA
MTAAPSTELAPLPIASVVVPCRNEIRFINDTLSSIVASDYPKDRLEVLIVDGSSDDGTTQVIDSFVASQPFMRRIDNPRRITPVALNLAVRASRGDFIIWMSAHNTYPPNYITECVRWALASQADNVGGIIITRPRSRGLWARAVVAAHTHVFGVGGSRFRTHRAAPIWADTVFGGCYRRSVFDRIGYFNEELVRGQDMEFNLRLKRAGGRTLLVPSIQSVYHARTRPFEFARYTWNNGVWAILPFRHSEGLPVGLRHLVPLIFVVALLAGLLIWLAGGGMWALALVGIPYLVAALGASAHVAWRERNAGFLFVMPLVFALFHLSYGSGSLDGLLRLAFARPRTAPAS